MNTSSPVQTTPSAMLRAGVDGAGFTIEGLPQDLTREQVLDLAGELLQEIHETTPIHPIALRTLGDILNVINEHRGTDHTVDTLAEACGVDLSNATRADE